MHNILKAISLSSVLILTACGSTPEGDAQQVAKSNYSGFLSDYSILKEADIGDDSQLKRFVSPELKARKYQKVMLDPISFHPAPQPSKNISQETLAEIGSYFNNTLSNEAGKKLTLVNQTGKDTLRVKMAITGVKIVDKDLKVYQYIPIAFVLNAASGGLNDMVVNFQIEAEVVDSTTGELLGAAVKSGVGETLNNDGTALTLAELKPLIDSWSKTMTQTLVESM